jgi:hypothetical protein
MTKARTLANFISDGSTLADGAISVSEVSGAAPLASPTFTGSFTSPGIDDDANAIAIKIDSSERVLIGTTSARETSGGARPFQIEGTSGVTSSMSITRNNNASTSPSITLAKTRGTTVGSDTAVTDNDTIGQLVFSAADGTDANSRVAEIQAFIDGTVASNATPGRLVFSTTADGAASTTERMRISEDGTVSIGSAAKHSSLLRVRDDLNGDTSVNAATGVITIQGAASTYSSFIGMDATGMSIGLTSSARNLRFVTNSATAMTIDTSRRVLIGLTSDIGTGHKLQVNDDISILTFDGTTTGADGIRFIKSRASSPGSKTIVADGDDVGFLDFRVDDGTDYASRTAVITSQVDGTPGVNDTPGRLVFFTTADGASSVTERMRISATGRVGIGVQGSNVQQSGSSTQLQVQDTKNDEDVAIMIRNYATGSNTSGSLRFVNTTSAEYDHATIKGGRDTSGGTLSFSTSNNNEAMRIDSAQRVLMGAGTNATSTLTTGWWNGSSLYSGILNVQNVNTGAAQKYVSLAVSRHSNDAESGQLGFAKSRGSAANSKTTVGVGDGLGLVTFQGADGSNYVEAARITGATDGTASADDMPGRLQFFTTADGASSPTERMRITNSGLVYVGTQSSVGTATGTVVQTGSSSSLANALIMAHTDVTAGSGNTGEAFCELQLKLGIQGKLRFHAEVDLWFYINTGPDRGSAKYIFAGYFNGGSSALDRYTVYNTDTDNIGIPVAYTSGSQKGIKAQFTNTNASNGLFGQMKVNVTWNP